MLIILEKVDWNAVAGELDITNGHAARMRFSRFKQQMEGVAPAPRKARAVGDHKKKDKPEKLPKPNKKQKKEGNKQLKDDADSPMGESEPMAGIEPTVKSEPAIKKESQDIDPALLCASSTENNQQAGPSSGMETQDLSAPASSGVQEEHGIIKPENTDELNEMAKQKPGVKREID